MKIIIATGGTGGHIFPAIETACILRDRGHEVIFVGVLGLGEEKVKSLGFKSYGIKAKGLSNKSLGGIISFIWLMLRAVVQSFKILMQVKPTKVVGFGGYGSFAVVFCAWCLRIPTMIHEQNVVPGKANLFLSILVRKIAISFYESQRYLGIDRIVLTGCPCHQKKPSSSREDLLKKFSLETNRKTILLLGGSQGSQKLNEIFFEAMSSWGNKIPVQVIHMTGPKECSLYVEKYQGFPFPVKVLGFINPIEEAYAISDVAIARAGASTVCELGFFRIPSILVPYPLADGHQKYNAQVLSKIDWAKIIEQKDLTKDILKRTLEDFLSGKYLFINSKIDKLFNGLAAQELATAVENLCLS